MAAVANGIRLGVPHNKVTHIHYCDTCKRTMALPMFTTEKGLMKVEYCSMTCFTKSATSPTKKSI